MSRISKYFQMGKKLGTFGIIVAIIEGFNQIFDYVFYPAAILWLGTVRGGVLMTIVALVLNYLIVVWYNRTNKDWFGIEWLHLQEKTESGTFFGRILRWLIRLGKWPAYLGITIYDPAYGFIYLRGRQSAGFSLTATDWKWFIISNVFSNFVWILLVSGVIESVRFLF